MSRRPQGHSQARFLTSAFAKAVLLSAATLAVMPSVYAAPDEPAPVEVENAQNAAVGIINANSVYVRCGPAESYYPTLKLEKGARVKVVGMKLDWLKIVPPDGSFCYISKAFVDRNGDGSVGKVNKDAVNVRAGSTLNTLKVVPLCQLSVGAEVKILGEQDEYFKIAPPEGKAFVYVNKTFVDPDPNAAPEPLANKGPANGGTTAQPTPPSRHNDEQPPVKPRDTGMAQNNNGGNKGNVEKPNEVADGGGPVTVDNNAGNGNNAPAATTQAATQPADDAAVAEANFDKAEALYASTVSKPLDQRPIDELVKMYEPLAASRTLANTLHRIAEARLQTLKLQQSAQTDLLAAKAAQEAMQKKQVALQAERKELEDRLQTLGVAAYTALGELQTSSLQLGGKTIYRLTDPANGRTVCYIRTDDPKVITYLGKFIGVKGDLSTEPQLSLKVVNLSDAAAVDPTKVNHGVTATIVPASMSAADDASTAAHVDVRP